MPTTRLEQTPHFGLDAGTALLFSPMCDSDQSSQAREGDSTMARPLPLDEFCQPQEPTGLAMKATPPTECPF
ncbi:MAG: hypothetical protein ABSG77_17325 [Candidatus Acidiferrum sp.]|jgi:hypothetical protein